MNDGDIRFKSIRAHSGRQDRAFEEIGFQLLTRDLDRSQVRLTRTGDPDAGAEWYTTDLLSGEQEAWQAKFIFDIDDLLSGMTKSVRAICKKRPAVKKLNFVIPWNLADGRSEGTKSARQKYDDKVATWKKTIDGADQLSFELVDESQLLGELAQERNRGIVRFFFDASVLSDEQLSELYDEAKIVAGRRYRPELQVDLPFQDQLDATAKRGGFRPGIDAMLGVLRKDWEKLRPMDQPRSESEAVIEAIGGVLGASEKWSEDSTTIEDRISAVRSALRVASEAVDRLTAAVRNADEELKRSAEELGEKYPKQNEESLWNRSHSQRRLADAIWRLMERFGSPHAKLFAGHPMFLTGEAGTGKTHLLLDAWGRILADSRPGAVLFADQFGPGPIWPQLAAQLGLPSGISKGELLGTLNACGAAAEDTRFVLAIDALNETTESTFWSKALPELEAAIRSRPHISLIVSIRSTYVDSVDPEGRRSSDYVHTVHPGLSGRESEATHLYFEHYQMQVPRHPLLTPEFSNPLFLRLYCETFRGDKMPPQGSRSRIDVFDHFLKGSMKLAATNLASSGSQMALALAEADARCVLDGILDELVESGGETLSFEAAVAVARKSDTSECEGPKVLAELEAQGILATAPMWFDGQTQRGMRVTFQALADHLLLRRCWTAGGLESEPDAAFVAWLRDASWGVQEAAAVWLPEVAGVELRQLLDGEFVDDWEGAKLDEMTLETLSFRSIDSFTDSTLDVVNRCLQGGRTSVTSVYSHLCAVAPIPGHPLNADRLHSHLEGFKMADRDAHFGVAIYDVLEDDGPFLRLAQWAQAGPYLNYDPQVVELASIPLVWLLTTPNRRMRDWVTKVLVNLLAGHLDVAQALVRRFARLDDLYVSERLAAIVYGLLMRLDGQRNQPGQRALVDAVVDSYLRNPRPNALMLDHVEGVVELASSRGLLDDEGIGVSHVPPYGFKPPHHPWTMKHIDGKYGYHRNRSEDYDFPYSGIYGSLFSMGDFGRYKIDSAFERFSRCKLDEDPPDGKRRGQWVHDEAMNEVDPVLLASVLQKLEASRTQQDVRAELRRPGLVELDADEKAVADRLGEALAEGRTWESGEPEEYPTETARRWIFMRSIQHGWTPDRFKDFESWRNQDSGRSANKAERFGKKYQWLGYFELLAKVRDNFHPMPGYYSDSDLSRFPGLWDTYDRDIDPSVPPVDDFEELAGGDGDTDTTWKPVDIQVRTPIFELPALTAFIEDSSLEPLTDYQSYPRAAEVSQALDAQDDSWLILDCYHVERIKDRSLEFGMSLDQETILRSWLTPLDGVREVGQAMADFGHRLHGSPFDTGHVDCCYVGELGWRDQGCYHRRTAAIPLDDGDDCLEITPTVEDNLWESRRFDCSITYSTVLSAPSAAILNDSDLVWDGNLSWLDQRGDTVAVNVGRRGWDRSHSFAVKQDWFRSWLAARGYGLVICCWTERRDFRDSAPREFHELASVLALDETLKEQFSGESSGSY